jgi:hypothetical protein
MSGKSDAIDAEHAARTALAGVGVVTPKLADGQVEAIRLGRAAGRAGRTGLRSGSYEVTARPVGGALHRRCG